MFVCTFRHFQIHFSKWQNMLWSFKAKPKNEVLVVCVCIKPTQFLSIVLSYCSKYFKTARYSWCQWELLGWKDEAEEALCWQEKSEGMLLTTYRLLIYDGISKLWVLKCKWKYLLRKKWNYSTFCSNFCLNSSYIKDNNFTSTKYIIYHIFWPHYHIFWNCFMNNAYLTKDIYLCTETTWD
jgi:hypothetical protein